MTPPEICPVCGEEVPRNAKACPECGADDRSGWRENADIYDGLDLPDHAWDEADNPGQSHQETTIPLFWRLIAFAILVAAAHWLLNALQRFWPFPFSMKSLLLFGSALVLALGNARAETPADKPNVLFIAIDDLNDWIGCLGGHSQARTPHMDRLAARGMLFTNAHCQAPLCNPSRSSIMLGLRPTSTGIYGLSPGFRDVVPKETRRTLGQHFAANGYRTLAAGKIFHGNTGRTGNEFQEWGPGASVGAQPEKKIVDTPSTNPLVDWGTFPHRDEDKGDWKVASWAVEQLDQLKDSNEPFFLAAGFFLPHVPCYATQKWFDLYPEDTLQLPKVLTGDRDDVPSFASYLHWRLPEPRLSWVKKAEQWKPLVRAYLASISFVDSQVGRVLDALEASGKQANTLVVLWSDHGFHLGEKDITGKNTLWQRSTHVPLIFAGPGVGPGQRCGRPAELLDLYPTLSEWCGLPTPEGQEGHSLAPQLRDPNAPRPWPAITSHNQGNHTVRDESHRYIRYADGSEELYNILEDPNEWTNLANDPAQAATIAALAKWLPKKDLPPAPGSAHRVLTYQDGVAVWEGETIDPNIPLPGTDD